MKVEVGNRTAIEGYRDEYGELKFSTMSGERVTTIVMPDDLNVVQAVQEVAATLTAHMEPNTRPAWIECDNPVVHGYLCQHFDLPTTSARPTTWGAITSLDAPKQTAPKKRAAAKKKAEPTPTTDDAEDES